MFNKYNAFYSTPIFQDGNVSLTIGTFASATIMQIITSSFKSKMYCANMMYMIASHSTKRAFEYTIQERFFSKVRSIAKVRKFIKDRT